MQAYIDLWKAAADQRALFLTCYRMMTENMLFAVHLQAFNDPAWVDRLLHRFADYYFIALDAYESDPAAAPMVWQIAHNSTRDPRIWPVQNLLLGVNAHINYDLVLTLVELLGPEWESLDGASAAEARRQERFQDYMHVNAIIADTIDAVQDEVLEPAMPSMDWVDRLFGRLDEWMISSMLTSWREMVWSHAVTLLENPLPDRQAEILQDVETRALQTARMIGFKPTAR